MGKKYRVIKLERTSIRPRVGMWSVFELKIELYSLFLTHNQQWSHIGPNFAKSKLYRKSLEPCSGTTSFRMKKIVLTFHEIMVRSKVIDICLTIQLSTTDVIIVIHYVSVEFPIHQSNVFMYFVWRRKYHNAIVLPFHYRVKFNGANLYLVNLYMENRWIYFWKQLRVFHVYDWSDIWGVSDNIFETEFSM